MAYHRHSDSAVSDELFFAPAAVEVESTALISPSCLSPSNTVPRPGVRGQAASAFKSTNTRDNAAPSVQATVLTTSADAALVYRGARVVVKQTPTSVSWRPVRVSLCGTEAAFVQKLLYPDILSARVVSASQNCAACHRCLDVSLDGHGMDVTISVATDSSPSSPLPEPRTSLASSSPASSDTRHWGADGSRAEPTPQLSDMAVSSDTACAAAWLDEWHVPPEQLEHSLVIFSYGRRPSHPNELRLKNFQLSSNCLEILKELAAAINTHVMAVPDRPRNLLVFLNPFSGQGSAKRIWKQIVQPIFHNSMVKYTLVSTEHPDHAKNLIASMKRDELEQYHGLVAVSGDGLFQELVHGVAAHRRGGACRLRLGHIPAGSTDAVAWTLHGTRSVITATLHVVLGSRMSVDLSRVCTSEGRLRYSMCMVGYGFLGDVMSASEGLRWMGPVRYDVAGALRYLGLRSYKVELQFRAAPAPLPSTGEQCDSHQVCYRACPTCRTAASIGSLPEPSTSPAASGWAEGEQGWTTVSGRFASIMCVTTPCRSDKSKSGVVPSAHLRDGQLVLVLVRACNHAQYLRFLLTLAGAGLKPGCFSFVELHRVSEVRVRSVEGHPSSVWNVDGELLDNPNVHIQVLPGMIDVFGRGLERPSS